MFPKLENKKLHYPKLVNSSSRSHNIHKLKLIQEFLESDTYHQSKSHHLHRQQESSLYSHRNIDAQKNQAPNPKSQNKQNAAQQRPKTRRQNLRLSELIDITVPNINQGKRSPNFSNCKLLVL